MRATQPRASVKPAPAADTNTPTEQDNCALRRAVAQDVDSDQRHDGMYVGGLHLAIMTGPFLAMIVEGTKTVESRFHRQRRDPLFSVEAGDLIVFRQSGQPATHVAEVRAAHYVDLTDVPIDEVRRQWGQAIGTEDESFWDDRRSASWVTLLELVDPRRLPRPVPLRKRDRRAWVRYGPAHVTA